MSWLLLLLPAAAAVWALGVYNGLVRLRLRGDGAWADIDVQLKRRHDLIPNVVEAVKGYAAHEQRVFVQVTQARTQAMAPGGPADRGAAEAQLAGSLKSLFAVAEAYPQLRANENFLGLQRSLTEIEEALQAARRYYNAVVRDYNTKLEVLPDRLIASAAGFRPKEFFQLESSAEAQAPRVSFS